jgi:hypothetical protein
MNINRGIFEPFSNQSGAPAESPFKSVADAESGQAASPFIPVSQGASPFSLAEEPAAKAGKPVQLPERRKVESPFQMAEPSEGFGYEAAPFTPSEPTVASKPIESPFAMEGMPAAPPASPAPFPQWGQPSPSAVPAAQTPAASLPAQPFAAAPQPFHANGLVSDSSSIRQLELRAIFGVDRELNADEILDRARALPGLRGIARVASNEAVAIDSLSNLAAQLGAIGPLKLYAGNVPVEFIREGSVLLAVQTDHSFAPGVRETLMIVARELGRLP